MPLTRTPLSRRQWLTTSGLLAGGTVLAPEALRAGVPDAPHVADGLSTPAGLAAHEAEVRATRAGAPVRLASNENPYGMGPAAKQAIMDGWAEHNRYGNASPNELRAVYAKSIGVPTECVLVVAGSSETLSIAALGYGLQGGELVTPWPTYEGLPRYAEAVGAKVHKVPLKADFTHDLEAMDRRITQRTSREGCCSTGGSCAQAGLACAQRGAKAQPSGNRDRVGVMPGICRKATPGGLFAGTESSRPRV